MLDLVGFSWLPSTILRTGAPRLETACLTLQPHTIDSNANQPLQQQHAAHGRTKYARLRFLPGTPHAPPPSKRLDRVNKNPRYDRRTPGRTTLSRLSRPPCWHARCNGFIQRVCILRAVGPAASGIFVGLDMPATRRSSRQCWLRLSVCLHQTQ